MALYANCRPTPSKAMLAFAKRPLAGVAVAHCEPQPKKRFLADAAGHPTVIANLLFVVVQRVKRPEINFEH
jgi:hypothetical protein